MKQKYLDILTEFTTLESQLQDPAIISDTKKLTQVSQDYAELKDVYGIVKTLEKAERSLAENIAMLSSGTIDPDMQELALLEQEELKEEIETVEARLKKLTRPTDPLDKKNIMIEIVERQLEQRKFELKNFNDRIKICDLESEILKGNGEKGKG
jgi:peptide chain release factor 1